MKCPNCGYDDSKVIDSRPTENRIRRRRECLKCKERFTTYEEIENTPLMVTKKNGSVEEFKRSIGWLLSLTQYCHPRYHRYKGSQ